MDQNPDRIGGCVTGEEVPNKLVGDEMGSENEQGIMGSMGGTAGR